MYKYIWPIYTYFIKFYLSLDVTVQCVSLASSRFLILRADSALSSRLTLICQFYKDTSTIPEGIWGFFTSPSWQENRQLLTSAVVKPTYGPTCRNPVISRCVLTSLKIVKNLFIYSYYYARVKIFDNKKFSLIWLQKQFKYQKLIFERWK